MLEKQLKQIIKEIPDFPKPGISFKDITPIFLNPTLVESILEKMEITARAADAQLIAGIDARGFLLGPALALRMQLPFVPIRKAGKLPRFTESCSYALEYGEASLQIHKEDVSQHARVFIHDDLLATGGTALAAAELIKKSGAMVCGFQFLVELDFLKAANALEKIASVNSLVHY